MQYQSQIIAANGAGHLHAAPQHPAHNQQEPALQPVLYRLGLLHAQQLAGKVNRGS